MWGLTGLPLIVQLAQRPALCHEAPYLLWLFCFFLFAVAFGLTGWREPAGTIGRRQAVSLALQTPPHSR